VAHAINELADLINEHPVKIVIFYLLACGAQVSPS